MVIFHSFSYLPLGKSGNPSALGAEDREFESLMVDHLVFLFFLKKQVVERRIRY